MADIGAADAPASRARIDGRSTRRSRPAWHQLRRLSGGALLLGLWWLTTATGVLDERTLPGPGSVLDRVLDLLDSGALQSNLQTSVARASTGLAIGVAFGVAVAVAAGLSRIAEDLLDAPVQMLRAMPILALVPLAIVWFGIGEEVKVLLVTLGVFFPIYLNTHAGIRGIDPRFIDLARTVRLSKWEVVRRVIVPGALPGFFAGLRYAATVAWLVLVVAEQINATSGIGYLMTKARSLSDTDTIMVGLFVYALLGLLTDTAIRLVETRVLRWRATLQVG